MIPLLPREMLWTDLKTMDQFYELDPVNKDFSETLRALRESPFDVKSDEVRVFNELYYQLTRMKYEKAMPRDLVNYIEEIRGNLGLNTSVELVMSMLYFINSLIINKEHQLNRLLAITIEKKYGNCQYWKPLKNCYNKIRYKKRINYDFRPRPVSISDLAEKYIQWNELTQSYNTKLIYEILSLWCKEKDRRSLIKLLQTSLKSYTLAPGIQKTYYNQITNVLKSDLFKKEKTSPEGSALEVRLLDLDKKVFFFQRENTALQNRVKELEEENNRQKALLEENTIHGKGRKFTLVEIVNYSKGLTVKNQADVIENMLNKLLRKIGTDEDYELVDSIGKDFENRKYGNTYINQQTIIPKLGNYKPQINTQNLELSTTPLGQGEQKLIEDE